ncbi:hypothetical protein JZ751_001223 [Albula glossodonta]|uniref:K Homology domain-containing protein n=1 Tax=Albula glossodonta TaxID=121402 RepID=A0A8T2PT32_9TELE|nr:hypothetical protein JZ751_001223 [Albula glossodonta]
MTPVLKPNPIPPVGLLATFPAVKVTRVVPSGETIKNINQQSGAHVELQRNPPPNTDPNVRIFSIRGTPQQMELARQLIDEKIGAKLQAPPPSRAPLQTTAQPGRSITDSRGRTMDRAHSRHRPQAFRYELVRTFST